MTQFPVASIENLRVEFPSRGGAIVAVEDASLKVFPGETLCIVGESGSGKSVTASSLMNLPRFSGGNIVSGDLKIRKTETEEIDVRLASERTMRTVRGNQIGMVFQEPMVALNPSYTIGWQISEGLMIHRGLSRVDAMKQAGNLLEKVRIPEPKKRLGQYPHELSGGMCQRAVIAMALACEPRLIIADEPTTALDVTVQAEILSLVDQLRQETGTAILLITHDMAVVAQMADRVAVMHAGSIVEEGPVRDILLNSQHDYTRALLAAVPKIGEMAGTYFPAPMKLPGTKEREFTPTQSGVEGLLKVRSLVKRFPIRGSLFGRRTANVHAVEDVSFTVRRHETLSLVGESGSGKSTVGKCLLRLEEPDSGEVQFEEKEILDLSPSAMRQQRRDMQMIFQDPYGSLNPQMRLIDQIAEPIRVFRLDSGSAVQDRVAELFDRVGMPRSFLNRFPNELSGGQRQRVAIARALAPNPKFIVADEAVSALDVSVQAQVLNLMMELQSGLGLSFLFISHDMAVVERISHRVAVMYMGRIVEIGNRADVFGDPRHWYTKELLAAVPRMDPDTRMRDHEASLRTIPSLVHPVGYVPPLQQYTKIAPEHFVLTQN